MSDPIEFIAQVYKVQTLVDNGIRVTLDLPETETVTMAKLAECQRFGVAINIMAIPVKHGASENVKSMAAGRKRKSEWTTAKEPDTNHTS